MGGFEGGDEAGFWEDTGPIFSVSKQKENKKKNDKLSINIDGLIYTIKIEPAECDTFTLESPNTFKLKSNLLYKAYLKLYDYTNDSDIVDFFLENKVVLTKLPKASQNKQDTFSSIVGFLLLIQDGCNLVLTQNELEQITKDILES